MSNGWDATVRRQLAEPWQDFWVELYGEPPLGAYLDLQEAAVAAQQTLTFETIQSACRTIEPLVKAHNLTDRDGKPIKELSLRTLSAGLFTALLMATLGAASPPPPAKRERLRGPSSPASRSRRASSSGSLPR